MSTEINTRGMVRSKAPGFPAGNDNECLTKSDITITEKALVNGSYGNNECPVIEDVVKAEIHPLQSEITIKRGTAGIINLSGYLQEIEILRLSSGVNSVDINKALHVGEYYQAIFSLITFNGDSISFSIPAIIVSPIVKYTFSVDGREYKITVTATFE